MIMRKQITCLLAVITAFSLLSGCAPTSSSPTPSTPPEVPSPSADASNTPSGLPEIDPMTLQFNIISGETSLQSQALTKMAELITERTNGVITVECFYNGVLADNKTCAISVADGAIDMTSGIGTSWMADYIPELGFASAPYMFESAEHWKAVFESDFIWDLVHKYEEAMGVTFLGFQYLGDRNVVSTKAAATPEEFAAITMRVPTTQAYLDAATALGVSPTSMSLSEVYLALQTKTIDAVEQALDSAYSYSFHEVTDYLIMTHHMYDNSGVLINTDLWNSLPQEYQELIQECVNEADNWLYETKVSENETYQKKLIEAGLTLIEPDISLFISRAETLVYPEYEEIWGAETVKTVKAYA